MVQEDDLMKLVSGILAGQDIDVQKQTVGALIEAPALYPNMTVEANLRILASQNCTMDYALVVVGAGEVAAYLKRKAPSVE